MKIINFSLKNGVPSGVMQAVNVFLADYVKDGTVELDYSVYLKADFWSVVFKENNVVGFSAHRLFRLNKEILIQVMATFIKPGFKHKKLSALLIQGHVFYKAFLINPMLPIYWCSRSRVPGAYIVAEKYSDLYPKLDNIFTNKKRFNKFCNYAKLVYGEHISLHPETYIMKNSYGDLSKFYKLDLNAKKSKYAAYFKNHINYDCDETLFLVAKVHLKSIITYIIANVFYQFKIF